LLLLKKDENMDRHKILIVEDDTEARKLYGSIMEKAGFEVITAESATEAENLIRETDLSVILADYALPGMSGIDLLKMTKEKYPDIMRLLITGYPEIGVLEEAINETEIYRFLSKPVKTQDLVLTVKTAVEHYELVWQNRELLKNLEKKIKEKTELLYESEKKYRTLVENIYVGIFRTSVSEDKLLEVNQSFVSMFGYSNKKEILGINVKHLYSNPGEREEYIREMETRGFVKDRELCYKRRNGTEFTGSVTAVAVKDDKGKIVYYDGIVEDITERKEAEKALRKSEEFNRALFEFNPIETVVVDREGRVIDFNCSKKKSGDRLPQAGDVMYKDYASKHEIDMYAELIDSIKTGRIKEFPEQKYDGKYLSIKIAPFLEGAIITSQDFTDQKKAEESLRDSEKFSSELLTNSPHPIVVINPDTSVRYVNPAFEKLTGFKAKKIIGNKPPYKWWPKKRVAKTRVELQRALQEGATGLEKCFLKKSGEEIWVEITLNPIKRNGELKYYLENWVDISDRKRNDNALGSMEIISSSISEEKITLDELYDKIGDELSKIIRADTYYFGILNKIRNELEFKYIKEKDKKLTSRSLSYGGSVSELVIRKKKPVFTNNLPEFRKEKGLKRIPVIKGEEISLSWIGVPVIIDNEVFGIVIIASNSYNAFTAHHFNFVQNIVNQISIAIKNERLINGLKESEEKYRNLVEKGNDGIIIVQDDVIKFANERIGEIFGYDLKMMFYKSFTDYLFRKERRKIKNWYTRLFDGDDVPQICETKMVTKTGEKIDVELNASMFSYVGKPALFIFVRDIRERKKAEEAVQIAERSSRLASLGMLAAGIAHEINQPLTALKLRDDGMLYWSEKDSEFFKKDLIKGLEDISDQSERIENIVKHMRELAHQEKIIKLFPVDINEVIKRALTLIDKQLSVHNVKIEYNFNENVPKIMGHSTLLEQIIINLVMNAMYVLDKSEQKGKKISIITGTDETGCYIEVADNGPGIPEEYVDRIFDPFFTTKAVGEGMGLGLSIIQNIVTGLGGMIKAGNRTDRGAVFTISFKPGE